MDGITITFVAIIAGAVCATIVHFLLKRLNNPEAGAFAFGYVYALILTLIVSAFAIAGLGLEGAINKANSVRTKRKQSPAE